MEIKDGIETGPLVKFCLETEKWIPDLSPTKVVDAILQFNEFDCITLQEASKALKVSVPTLHKMNSEGKLRFVRIGKTVRIPKTEMLRIIADK